MWQYEVSGSRQIKCQDCVKTSELHTLQRHKPAVWSYQRLFHEKPVDYSHYNPLFKAVTSTFPVLAFYALHAFGSGWFAARYFMMPQIYEASCDRHGSSNWFFWRVGQRVEDALSRDNLWHFSARCIRGRVSQRQIWCVWRFSHPVASFLGAIHSFNAAPSP